MTRISLLPRPCPSPIPWLFLIATLASLPILAAPPGFGSAGSVIGDDVLYRIGGGNAVNMGRAGSMQSIGVGVGWNNNLMCGNMDLSTTLHNQLNGLTDGFQSIMGSLIQNATGAVASLPALIIQRADPGLYNLLTNGILQARLDFDRSKASCRAMAERMVNVAGNQSSWGALAEGQALKEAIAQNQDAVAVTARAESDKGNTGVPWVGGDKAGGRQQPPIQVIKEVTRAGYNLLNGRSATDTASIAPDDCNSGLLCDTWQSPDEAAAFANRVLGEVQQQTCEGCTQSTATAGVGLTPLIQEEYASKLQALQALIAGSKPTSLENLAEAGSNSMPITRGIVTALRDEPDQQLLAQRLASEIAVTSVLEKALLLQRTLLAGNKEPNVAANEIATQTINGERDTLQQEITNLRTELELRRSLTSNSPAAIIARHQERKDNSRTIYEGDPDTNRLESMEKNLNSNGRASSRP
ncbi:integrating conjugative element protein [Pseudomonas gingeri]|uniref:Integrating conjugative element protein n=1 Tax=Pseudomonas gingeri TaxID=117681 RepID=A0A7Y8CKD9_9PSED|nr:integrating conjugative element protein [Pseudomonas gingeri]NWB28978.1 integrating conjugative element protein [Pseudomonas gingeri]NWC34072.1 integrating conjugative element protein [Pseudomonas gingeri]NWD04859.1 integrating conjugative element protein [Pseudomonas gingeri]NWE30775.1 integrating conjugative element protein [Pseudomonas gingeri]NWE58837.1 integrating conjugative element protein [Pseudomonas gingeri]